MNTALLPVLLPLVTAIACLLWGRPSAARRVFVGLSAAAQLGLAAVLVARTFAGETLVLAVGNWVAPFGIVLVVDLLAAVMLALSTFTGLMAILHGFAELPARVEHPLRLPLVQFILAGIHLAFCTGDLFNLFVAFEIMLIASYALLTLEADDWDVKQAFPYVMVNLVGSVLFLCAAGFTYALFGTLNFADVAQRAATLAGDSRVTVLALLLLVVFGIKAGVFPLYYWLPNSYPTLPAPLAGFYAGLLTKVGVYVLLRVFGTVLPHDLTGVHTLLAWLAGATMVLGVLGALSRNFIRGILSYHILSQIGFMVLAIGLFTPLSLAACVFYVIHHIVVKSSLFLVGGVAALLNGTDHLDRMGNLWRVTPWVGGLFLVQALSLAGLPPLSGFWGKYAIFVAGLEQGTYVLVGAAVVASLLTLVSMLKIWNSAFWLEAEGRPVRVRDRRWVRQSAVVTVMAAVSLGIGFGAEGVFRVAQEAARQALDQPGYVRVVTEWPGKSRRRATMNPLALNLLIATLWLFLSSGRSTIDFFLGFVLGFVLLAAFHAVLGRRDYARRTAALVMFVLRFIRQFILANLNVAATVVSRRPESLQPHFFTYDVAGLRLGEILILSYCITLTPGTATVQISEDQRTLVLHGLDVEDVDALRRELDRTLKEPLLRVTR